MLLLIQYTLIFSSVLILVALGGCISEHSGVINLGLEGIMVIGALGGALMMRFCQTESALVMVLLVILAAAFFGLVYSALLGVACINFKADQTLVGTALNLLGTAAATVFVKALNTSMNPDDHSSEIEYVRARKMFITNGDRGRGDALPDQVRPPPHGLRRASPGSSFRWYQRL